MFLLLPFLILAGDPPVIWNLMKFKFAVKEVSSLASRLLQVVRQMNCTFCPASQECLKPVKLLQ
jgi:hypothetical protein